MAETLTPEYLDQTWREKQLRYDLQTQFAEVVNGQMQNDFELQFNGEDLIGEDGRSIRGVIETAIVEANELVRLYPELKFELSRRSHEQAEIDEAILMAAGHGPNTIVVISDFPAELVNATEDVGGYNVERQQAMLRVLIRKPDGNLHMYSQSLDQSNRRALEAIHNHLGNQPQPGELLLQRIRVNLSTDEQISLINDLTKVYDQSLAAQFGGQWQAGRPTYDRRNTYDFVCSQTDLIEECVRLQNLGWLNDEVMYKMAAAMQARFARPTQTIAVNLPSPETVIQLHQEIDIAGDQAKAAGKSFSACGVTLKSDGLDNSIENQIELAGYGNKSAEDKYGSLTFKCQKGHINTRPRNTLIDKCKVCKVSVKC